MRVPGSSELEIGVSRNACGHGVFPWPVGLAMTPIPVFYYSVAVAEDSAVLDEGDGFFIYRRLGIVGIECQKPWKREFEEAYRHHEAESVSINTFSVQGWEGLSLDFLVDLPGLRHVVLIAHLPMDLTPLGQLSGLESLTLLWRVHGSPCTIDFARLVRLKECKISWHPTFAPILRLGSLVVLRIVDAKGLKGLDLSELPRLAELDLMSCAALTQIHFSERAKLIALELTNCHKLRPDWRRLALDLRHLCLRDRIGFAVEEVVEAQALQFLWAQPSNKHPTWEFLRDLPCLEAVCVFDLKIKKKIAELFKSINQSNGHGPTLCARPKPHDLTS
jgi:hypothetical protein